jgi:hypothetical protein
MYGCETWSPTIREERWLRVFENIVLRIFGPKRDEVIGEWRKLHNEDLNDLHSSPNTSVIQVILLRTVSWVRHEARTGRGEDYTAFCLGKNEEIDHLEDPGADGRIIFRWIFKKWDGGMNWIDLAQDRDR